jgi:Cell division septal protein
MARKRKNYSYRRNVVIKPGNYRSRQKGRKLGKFFVYAVIFSVACALFYIGGKKLVDYAYAAESMMVKDIEVVGCKNVTKTEIKELLPFKIGDNILKIDLSEAETEIKKVKPELKNISIGRRWQKVRVKLYERVPEAFVREEKDILGIDFDNQPFPLRGFMSGMKIPVIVYKTEEERKALLSFIKAFKPASGEFMDNISEINFSNSGDIVFKTYDEAVIYWGEERTEYLAHKFDKLQKIYADASMKYKQIEYIDMTFYGLGKAVVKPKEEETPETAKPVKL